MAAEKVYVLFVLVLYSCYNTSFCYLAGKMNKTSAERFCSNHGGLVSYERFISKHLSEEETLLNPLDDQSAWINGYVTFSKFVSFHSCFPSNLTMQQYRIDDNGLFTCLRTCTRYGKFELIGVNNVSCYCLNYKDLTFNDQLKLSDKGCGIILGTNNSRATITLNVAVYKIETSEYLSNEAQQCVYMKKSSESQLQYGTDSCYSGHGYMCISEYERISNLCQHFFNDTLGYCLKNTTLDWFDASRECRHYNGKLAISAKPFKEVQNMQPDKLYWTGSFRDFQVVSSPENSSNNNSCVSIRKVANMFYFDPDDCAVPKFPLCNDGIVAVKPSLYVLITSVLAILAVVVVLCVISVVFFKCRTCKYDSVQRRIKLLKTGRLRSHYNEMSTADKTPNKLVKKEQSIEVTQNASEIYSVAKDVLEGVNETTQYATPVDVVACTILKENAYDKIGQKEANECKDEKKTSATNIYSHTNWKDASNNSPYDVIGERAIKQGNKHLTEVYSACK